MADCSPGLLEQQAPDKSRSRMLVVTGSQGQMSQYQRYVGWAEFTCRMMDRPEFIFGQSPESLNFPRRVLASWNYYLYRHLSTRAKSPFSRNRVPTGETGFPGSSTSSLHMESIQDDVAAAAVPTRSDEKIGTDTNDTGRAATEDEIKTLRHVTDRIPLRVWLVAFIAAAERFTYWSTQVTWQNYSMYNTYIHTILNPALATQQ